MPAGSVPSEHRGTCEDCPVLQYSVSGADMCLACNLPLILVGNECVSGQQRQAGLLLMKSFYGACIEGMYAYIGIHGLRSITLHYIQLHYTTLHYIALLYFTFLYFTLPCIALHTYTYIHIHIHTHTYTYIYIYIYIHIHIHIHTYIHTYIHTHLHT